MSPYSSRIPIVKSQIAVEIIIAIPTMSLALPVNVNQAIKKPNNVNICAIDSFTALINHLPIAFSIVGVYLINLKICKKYPIK